MEKIKKGRRPLPEGMKKEKLTLSVNPFTKEILYREANESGVSISQMLDEMAMEIFEKRQKSERKASREAKKAAKENEQLPGQITTEDLGI